jgi:hypothetical protein
VSRRYSSEYVGLGGRGLTSTIVAREVILYVRSGDLKTNWFLPRLLGAQYPNAIVFRRLQDPSTKVLRSPTLVGSL